MKSKRKTYEAKLEKQLKDWSDKIIKLEVNMKKSGKDVKKDYLKTIGALKKKRIEAVAKINELKSSGDNVWAEVKKGVEKTWVDVKNTYTKSAAVLKKVK